MNSFSSIVTVSNFKTAGRAMLVLALFMMSVFASSYSFAAEPTKKPAPVKKPAAAKATATAAAPAAATAAAQAPTPYNPFTPKTEFQDVRELVCGRNNEHADSPKCKDFIDKKINEMTGANRVCEAADREMEKAQSELSKFCSEGGIGAGRTCIDKMLRCEDDEKQIVDDNSEEDEFNENLCEPKLMKSCSHLPTFYDDRDYRQEEKDAKRDRDDAKKDVDDLLDDQQKLQTEQIRAKQELQEQMQNASRNLTRKSQEIMDGAKKDKEGLSESTRKAIDDARSVYNQMDAKYIELRDKARRATSNVRRAQDQLQATCRASASANYAKAEAARLAAQKLGKRNVGSATNMAGGSKRKAAKDVRARNADYVNFFNECTGGVSPEGRSAVNAINKAADDLKDEEQLIADQSALIEKQRLEVLQKLKEMENSVPQKEQKIIEAMNQELKNLHDDYNEAVKTANEKANALQQEMSGKLMSIQNKLNSAQQKMQEYANEALVAKRRQMCGRGSSSKKSDSRDNARSSVIGSWNDAKSICKRIKKCTLPGEDRDKSADSPYKGFCDDMERAHDTKKNPVKSYIKQ